MLQTRVMTKATVMMQARVITQARTQILVLAVTVFLAVTAAQLQLTGRLDRSKGERGSQTLEWAIIAGIVCGLALVVALKVTNAVNTHAAQIK